MPERSMTDKIMGFIEKPSRQFIKETKNKVDDFLLSPVETLVDTFDNVFREKVVGGGARQLGIPPEFVNPDKAYSYDPDNYQEELLKEFEKFEKRYKNSKTENKMYRNFNASNSYDGKKYYDELYKSVSGIEGVMAARKKAGMNVGAYTPEERLQIEKYNDRANWSYPNTRRVTAMPTPFELSMDAKSRPFTMMNIDDWGKDVGGLVNHDAEKYEPGLRVGLTTQVFTHPRELGVTPKEILHHEMQHVRQDGYPEQYKDYDRPGFVPMNEIEAVISQEMNKWQRENKRILLNKKDMEDFLNEDKRDMKYGDDIIPPNLIRIIAPRIVQEKTNMFKDLT
jgi:hypothetical protein